MKPKSTSIYIYYNTNVPKIQIKLAISVINRYNRVNNKKVRKSVK